MSPEQQEQCRRLADWLGWKFLGEGEDAQWHHPECTCVAMAPEHSCACHDGCYWFNGDETPDFFHSEEANAMLLEKLTQDKRFCCVEVVWDGEGDVWNCQMRLSSREEYDAHLPIQPNYSWPDRKTAVVLAAIAYLDGKEKADGC